jgi:hypothetical protein
MHAAPTRNPDLFIDLSDSDSGSQVPAPDPPKLSATDGIPDEYADCIAQLLSDKRISTIKLGSYIGQAYVIL